MNIDDALLVRRVLNALEGSTGKTPGQLAAACHTTQRRMTHILFCLEKTGLVVIHENALATLADELLSLVWRHADKLDYNYERHDSCAHSQQWQHQAEAQRMKSAADSKAVGTMFNEIFGGVSAGLFGADK